MEKYNFYFSFFILKCLFNEYKLRTPRLLAHKLKALYKQKVDFKLRNVVKILQAGIHTRPGDLKRALKCDKLQATFATTEKMYASLV